MNNPSSGMRSAKLDLSPYLFHFIKGYVTNPIYELRNMLQTQQIYSRSKNDFICFTSSPITQVGDFFETNIHGKGNPMYQSYGLAFPRDLLIQQYGARNVIYYTDICEFNAIETNPNVKQLFGWRSMYLNPGVSDWEWLREWRTPGSIFDFSKLSMDDIIVITPTQKELLDIVVNEQYVEGVDYDPETNQEYPELYEDYNRRYKGISLERIKEANFVNDYNMMAELNSQHIGEDMFEEEAEQMRKDVQRLNELIAKENAWLYTNIKK